VNDEIDNIWQGSSAREPMNDKGAHHHRSDQMSNAVDKMEKEFLKGKGMKRPELSTDYYNRKLESKFFWVGSVK
jgi:hypothetical protein